MASTISAAHSPAVNHPTNLLAGYSVTHSPAAEAFVTEGVRHGSEVGESTATSTLGAAVNTLGLTPAQQSAIDNAVSRAIGQNGAQGSYANYVQNIETNLAASGAFTVNELQSLASSAYLTQVAGNSGQLQNKGGGNTAGLESAADGALSSAYNAAATTAATAAAATAAAATTATTTPATDFSQLATLLSSLAGSTPAATTSVPDNSPGTSVPTTSAPSMVIPLLLILLAAGVGYWWWMQHHHKKAAAA